MTTPDTGISQAVRPTAGVAAAAAEPGAVPSCGTALLRQVLASDKYYADYMAEYRPVGPTELALVRELARHASAADRWDAGSLAVERQAATHLPRLGNSIVVSAAMDDELLAAAMANEAADRCEKHCLLRSRAFLATLEKLESTQASRRQRERHASAIPELGFADEQACERYLFARFAQGAAQCPGCGGREGSIVAARKCWECRACKKQIGIRAGTVMARSAIPLRQWFDAIRWVLWRPTMSANELSERLILTRLATVRSIVAKIRGAIASEDATALLAGLDTHFSQASLSQASQENTLQI